MPEPRLVPYYDYPGGQQVGSAMVVVGPAEISGLYALGAKPPMSEETADVRIGEGFRVRGRSNREGPLDHTSYLSEDGVYPITYPRYDLAQEAGDKKVLSGDLYEYHIEKIRYRA